MRRAHSPSLRPLLGTGFTLLELMIVIAVLGVFAAFALPGMSYLSRVTRVKNSATTVYLAMLKARSEAVKRNSQVTFAPLNTSDWSQGWTVRASDGTVLLNQEPLPGVTIVEKAGKTSLVWLSSGRISGGVQPGLSITYTQKSGDRTTAVARCVSAGPSGAPFMTPAVCS